MLREAGALEVHVRISSPPVKWPCFYGIDFATRAELIANGLTPEEIAASVGADTLGYISLDGMIDSTKQTRDTLCTACFTGEYPVELPDESLLGKHLLEATLQSPTHGPRAAGPQQPLIRTPPSSPPEEPRDRPAHRVLSRGLRRRRGLDRGGRPRDRPDEGLGREGPPPRGDRRPRRLRRALRRLRPHPLRAAAAGHLDRRRRHQGRDRAADGRARHDRLRPRRHGRRRPRRLRRRAALHDRLHRLRPRRPRAHRGDRQGHRRGVRRRRLRPHRRRDRRAPRPARPRRLRRRGRHHRRGRGQQAARPRPRPPRRRGDRDGGQRPALQRLLARAPRAARLADGGAAGPSTATSTTSAARWARSCSSRPASTPRPASTSPTAPRPTPCPT